MVEVVITDDHPLVREGLKKVLLKSKLKTTVKAEASNAEELLEILEKNQPDLVILDIGLPGQNGLDALKELKKKYPDLLVLMLSMHPEDRFAVRTLKAGASGYLTKESIPKELETAVETIVKERKKYISPEVAETLAKQIDTNTDRPLHDALSDREFQVMRMIAAGKTINEIAEELSLSDRTVHTYRTRLMGKMNMDSNVALTHYALNNNLIEKS